MKGEGKRVAACTLGCKVNMYDTEAMLRLFGDRGYEVVDFSDEADIYIINTCTVTNLGDRKSRQAIRRAHRRNPDAVIAAVGCYAQAAPEEAARIEGVQLVLGTAARGRIVDIVEQYRVDGRSVCDVGGLKGRLEFEPLSVDRLSDRQRAFLKIQDGCDRFCSYCIIPHVRGPVRSRREEDVLREAAALAAGGYREIVFTGIHVASYGRDLEDTGLVQLLRRAHEVPGIDRIRLSSLEPTVVDDGFIAALRDMPKICPHFHLSLQSGCGEILRRMNRRYTPEEYRAAVGRVRALWGDTAAVTTDVIVGFPGETERDFQESMDFVRELELAGIHVFPYSPKRGTPAAEFKDQVPPSEKRRRAEEMLALGAELKSRFMAKQLGRTFPVLIERALSPGIYEGLTPNYISCATEIGGDVSGDIINSVVLVKLDSVEQDAVYGKYYGVAWES